MPEPVPTPTALQIVTVAEIAMVTVDEVRTMIAADDDQDISDAKWSLTLVQIDEWGDIGSDPGDIKKIDTIEFFEGVTGEGRLDFRNTLRLRYGLCALITENPAESNLSVRSLRWF
jgi:hypothetical protein